MRPTRHGRGARSAVLGRADAHRRGCAAAARSSAAQRGGSATASGWRDTASDGDDGTVDRLHNLGKAQNYNINVDHGQSSVHLDALFTGGFLGTKSDIASGELRREEFRTYNNICGDYYIAQRFLHRVAMHIAKNYLAEKLRGIKVPLLLGIWGPKGTGKTFQTELSFKKMKVEAVVMSSGELESVVAGSPGYLIRKRYRAAADMSKSRGVLSCLLVNDIDAGLGRFEGTQCTVNNQIVCSTLMNMCDDPTHVSIGEVWREADMSIRVPVIVTGNDFSTLFAPLIRDGRMDKFFWEPDMEEKLHMVYQMYKEEANLQIEDISKLIQRFGNQTLDFFGAIRASTYDDQILQWIRKEVCSEDLAKDSNLGELSKRLLKKSDLPEFEARDLTLDALIEEGDRLVYEQEMVNKMRLSEEYMANTEQHGPGISMLGMG